MSQWLARLLRLSGCQDHHHNLRRQLRTRFAHGEPRCDLCRWIDDIEVRSDIGRESWWGLR